MKKLIYAAMLLLGLSITTSTICYAQDLSTSNLKWIRGEWRNNVYGDILDIYSDSIKFVKNGLVFDEEEESEDVGPITMEVLTSYLPYTEKTPYKLTPNGTIQFDLIVETYPSIKKEKVSIVIDADHQLLYYFGQSGEKIFLSKFSDYTYEEMWNMELGKARKQLAEDLANHRYDWLYGTWKLDFLDEVVIIDKDYVYYDESRSNKEPFNLRYELYDPYNEYLDYGVYLFIGNISIDEEARCLYFADEFNIMPYEKISSQADNGFESQEIFTIVEKMPSFPGGEAKLMEYIAKSIRYPQIARETGIQGRVFVSFVVEPDGSLSNVKVQNSIGGGCDEEAVRIVKSMPNWAPGEQRGKPVRVSYMLPVSFKLQ